MDYKVKEDSKLIREILNITQSDLASAIGVSRNVVVFCENGKTNMGLANMERLYSYAFSKGVHLNKIKAMFYQEEAKETHLTLFHASKGGIKGEISPSKGRANNDFGHGFYCGESYEQPVSLVSSYPNPSLYIIDFLPSGLKGISFNVDGDWMLAVAYFRGTLSEYKDHPIVKRIVSKVESADYIVAPIADNRMFRIIDSFIAGEITDEQCKHCLAATDLGKQYVFLTDKSVRQIKILERCFICEKEKEHFLLQKEDDLKMGDQKVRAARSKYRGAGQYIDEILK